MMRESMRKTVTLSGEHTRAVRQMLEHGSPARVALEEVLARSWLETGSNEQLYGPDDPLFEAVADGPDWNEYLAANIGSESAVLRTLLDLGLERIREAQLEAGYRRLAQCRHEEQEELEELGRMAAAAWPDDD